MRAIAAGPYRTCAVLADGTALCWGAAWARYTPKGDYPRVDRPTPISGLAAVEQIVLGEEHACARLADGTVRCWGRNREGELGDGTNTDSEQPTTVQGLGTVTEIAAGAHHSCAVGAGGKVSCWGRNHVRQLGVDGQHVVPAEVAALGDTRQLALGANHSCALSGDGTVRCWGILGPPLAVPTPVVDHAPCPHPLGMHAAPCPPAAPPVSPPAPIRDARGAVQLGAGGFSTCARMGDGRVLCWGSNATGILGDGTQTERVGVVNVRGLCPASSLAVAEGSACVVCADRSVRCWGDNPRSGHTAMPEDDPMYLLRPTPILGLDGVMQVARSDHHACALGGAGTVQCWGGNGFGEVGSGTHRFERDPVAVAW